MATIVSWEVGVVARTLAQEVRGEPNDGQSAVCWVIRNRLETGRWGKSLASVCLWRAQFSGWYVPTDPNFSYACNLRDDDPVLEDMADIFAEVMAADPDSDPTFSATHYANLALANPPWIQGATQTAQIGHHTFFKNVK